MKPYDILDALGEIDSDLLAACEDYTASRIARRKTLARCAAGVCAVLLLAVGIGTPLLRRTMTDNAVEQDAAAPLMTETAAENVEVTVQSSYSGTAPGDMASPVPPTEDAAEDVSESPMYSYSDLQDKIEVEVQQQPSTVPTVDASPEDEVEYEVPAEDDGADIVVGEDNRYKDKTLSTESTAGKAELPMLSFSLGDSGFGFEGILLYEDETPVNYNLLDMYGTPETLPVFKNLAFYDTSGLPVYLDDETLLRMGLDYADYFGYEVLSYDTKWDWDDEDIPGDLVRIDTTYADIFVEGNGETTIRFKQEKELAADGSLAEDIDFGTAEKMLARLSELYINLIGGKNVQYDIRHNRMFDGSPIRSYSVFPVTEDARTTYLNASFATVTFGPGGSGGLGSLQIKNGLHAAEGIGDYPLISEEEATKRLLDGRYLTTVPSEYLADSEVTEDAILSCELTYHNGQADTHFIPYYHYYVRLDEFSDNGSAEDLVTYGGYWVPAVHPDYLDPDTVWDGRFN